MGKKMEQEMTEKQEGLNVEEKIYKTMGRTGSSNIAVGILVLVCGVVTGVLMIVTGANLLRKKGKVLF